MRTVAHVIADLEHAGYYFHVLMFEALEAHLVSVRNHAVAYSDMWYDLSANAANRLRRDGVLCTDDQLLLDEWIVQQQLIGEASRDVNV